MNKLSDVPGSHLSDIIRLTYNISLVVLNDLFLSQKLCIDNASNFCIEIFIK